MKAAHSSEEGSFNKAPEPVLGRVEWTNPRIPTELELKKTASWVVARPEALIDKRPPGRTPAAFSVVPHGTSFSKSHDTG
jgi:hypothetical protein